MGYDDRNASEYPGVREALSRIGRDDEALHAWAFVDKAPNVPRSKSDGALANVAFGVKDIIDVRGMPTRFGLAIDASPARLDAWCVAALRAAGAVPVGKTHTTALAWQDPAPTLHPHVAQATPGGSSSGSAAAVAAGHVAFALATQTVGSTLRPAAYCGITGYKPTYGTVPAFGATPLAASLDTIGVIARNVEMAAAFGLIFGFAATRLAAPPRLAFAAGAFADLVSQEVVAEIAACVAACERAGAAIERPALPQPFFEAFDILQPLVAFEAHAVHEPWRAFDLPPKLDDLLRRGAALPESARLEALAFRTKTRHEIDAALAPFDALLLVVADIAPSRNTTGDGRPQAPATFYGLPAITIPIGRTLDNHPIGLQLIAGSGCDARLLGAARWVEDVLAADKPARHEEANARINNASSGF